jgi:hypothetical protein
MKQWIIRIGDGENFINSKRNIYGIKDIWINKSVKNIEPGDVLWFLKKDVIVGMAEFTQLFCMCDEPLIQLNTVSNSELGWTGSTDYEYQIHYKNLYLTERQNIKLSITKLGSVINYESDLLKKHYDNFLYYGRPDKYYL